MGQKCIERIEQLALIDAAVGEHLDYFSLLLFFQIESLAILEGLEVVFSTYNSLEHSFFDICSHVLLLRHFHDLIDLFAFEFIMFLPSLCIEIIILVFAITSCFPPAL